MSLCLRDLEVVDRLFVHGLCGVLEGALGRGLNFGGDRGGNRISERSLAVVLEVGGLVGVAAPLEVGVVCGPAGLVLFLRGEATLAVVSGCQCLYILFRQQFEAFGKLDREHDLREGDCCETETTLLGHDLFADRIKVDVGHRTHMTKLILVY